MDTYVVGRGHTSHYKQPGSHLTYCGRTTGTPGVGTRMCAPCVKAEARERAEAEAVANDHREGAAEQALAQSLTPKMRKVLPAVVAAGDFRDAGLANLPKGVTDPSLQGLIRRGLAEKYDTGETFVGFEGRVFRVMHYRATDRGRAVAAALAVEQADTQRAARTAEARERAEAQAARERSHRAAERVRTNPDPTDPEWRAALTELSAALDHEREVNPIAREAIDAAEAEFQAGTWRAEWIGAHVTSPEPTLFDVEPDTEQGALFA
ncbi:hypothetical protein ACIQ6R_18060 [Streptomyces sp. NPDC096048]|uniref:hypothetical protein n=1 Tax=Streptomyces sp. NPDC096048 TaxID=3366072 RepID=UPI003829CEB4